MCQELQRIVLVYLSTGTLHQELQRIVLMYLSTGTLHGVGGAGTWQLNEGD